MTIGSRRHAPGSAIWVDGERVAPDRASIDLADPAAQSGLGLFETVALRDGVPVRLEAHLQRMLLSAPRLGIETPPIAELRESATVAAGDNEDRHGWLKILLTGAGRCLIWHGPFDAAEIGKDATAVLLPWRRSSRDPLAGMKTLSYAGNLVGLDHARRKGADEGLWLNERGHLTEGCASNLFVVRHRSLFTARVSDGVLPGVVRALVIDAAAKAGIPVHEGKLRTARLARADEAFLTSSLRGVRPLVGYEGKPIGTGRAGPITRRLAASVHDDFETSQPGDPRTA